MAKSIAQLISELNPDPWRIQVGFSPEIEAANHRLFSCDTADSEIDGVVSEWLARFQPCLFGRIAARTGHLTYCFLKDSDLSLSDEHIQDTIQTARTAWTREGFYGRKSGFVILAISEPIATAVPDEIVKQIARLLTDLHQERSDSKPFWA